LITSGASVMPTSAKSEDAVAAEGVPGLYVRVERSQAKKCVRCWHHRDDVGAHAEHPELCGRCVTNVSGAGETRHYA